MSRSRGGLCSTVDSYRLMMMVQKVFASYQPSNSTYNQYPFHTTSFPQGWITDSGDVKLERVQVIMTELGHMEDEIFKRRHTNEINFKAKDRARKRQQQRVNFEMLERTQFAPMVSRSFLETGGGFVIVI